MTDLFDPKEKLLIEFMISDRNIFVKCSTIVKPEYFEMPLNNVVSFILKYYTKYHNIPSADIVFAETEVKLEAYELDKSELDYLCEEIEKHCKESAMRIAIISGAEELSEEDVDFGKISNAVKDALMISLDKDMGTSLFLDPEARLMLMQEHIDARSIGWVGLDIITSKCKRAEMFMFAGNSQSGKSVILANIAANMAVQEQNVLIVSLELGEDLVTKRMDSIVTGIETTEVFNSIADIVDILGELEEDYGAVHVKRMPLGTNANAIRAYLNEYHVQFGYFPDVICVDYLDLLATNEVVRGNVFDIDKVKSEELREIFEDYNCYGFTASQLNRDAIDTEHKSQAHIAGGLSKINTCDVAFAITRDQVQQDCGEVHLSALKLRNSAFSSDPVVLHWNDKTLKITDSPSQHVTPSTNTAGTVKKTVKSKSNTSATIGKLISNSNDKR